jgi:hypothetical protein
VSTAYLLIPSNPDFLDIFAVERELESAIVHEIGARARVDVPPPQGVQARAMSESSKGQYLVVAVWLPWLAWYEATVQKTTEVINKTLNVPTGYYDRGFLVIWAGGPLNVASIIELTMPTALGN